MIVWFFSLLFAESNDILSHAHRFSKSLRASEIPSLEDARRANAIKIIEWLFVWGKLKANNA